MDEQDDSNLSLVVARADALMQRRRQGSPTEGEDLPVLTETIDPDDDLPILFAEDEPIQTEEADAEPQPLDPAVLEILAHELARRMGQRLADEIPDLVATALQSALNGVTEELRQGLAASTEAAISDFLAEREKLARLQQQD